MTYIGIAICLIVWLAIWRRWVTIQRRKEERARERYVRRLASHTAVRMAQGDRLRQPTTDRYTVRAPRSYGGSE